MAGGLSVTQWSTSLLDAACWHSQMSTRFAIVRGMADDQSEPGEITERFRAFAETTDPAPSKGLPIALIAGAVVIVVLLIIAIFALGS
jgi:hypothetical protein